MPGTPGNGSFADRKLLEQASGEQAFFSGERHAAGHRSRPGHEPVATPGGHPLDFAP